MSPSLLLAAGLVDVNDGAGNAGQVAGDSSHLKRIEVVGCAGLQGAVERSAHLVEIGAAAILPGWALERGSAICLFCAKQRWQRRAFCPLGVPGRR